MLDGLCEVLFGLVMSLLEGFVMTLWEEDFESATHVCGRVAWEHGLRKSSMEKRGGAMDVDRGREGACGASWSVWGSFWLRYGLLGTTPKRNF